MNRLANDECAGVPLYLCASVYLFHIQTKAASPFSKICFQKRLSSQTVALIQMQLL